MTKAEAAKKMQQIAKDFNGDPEAAHSYADDLLIEVLRSLGYDELIKAYMGVNKWYA